MLYRKLGQTDIDASVVALGAWAIGGWMWGGCEEADAVRAIQASLDHGVNLIDTAPIYGYGRSERIVGKAIRSRRSQVVLATKCGLRWDLAEPHGVLHFQGDDLGIVRDGTPGKYHVYKYLHPDSIRLELEGSLQRLGTDYVDLYQTHWQDETTPIDETMAALETLRDQGKIRAIGISNANRDQLVAYGPIDGDQERYSMLDRRMEQDGCLEYCRANHISVLAYSPLVHGLLTGKITPQTQFHPGDLRIGNPRFSPDSLRRIQVLLAGFAPIARAHGASLAQLVIAWTFSRPGLTHVLCGARNERQAIENARAGELPLAQDEIEAIDELIRKHLKGQQ
ncbi:MAG: aldo/keto reductase [Sedimentisphaerales bacterium]|nr:aldo/keto reductase [Sedimentisphaerales bacterium]